MANLRVMNYGNYKNMKATENVIRYVTRTRINEDRANELVCWDGYNVACFGNPEAAIAKFGTVRNTFRRNKEPSPQIRHETLGFTDTEFRRLEENFGKVEDIAVQCCKLYDAMGYQVIYAIHDTRDNKDPNEQNNGVHIHFVINAYNYENGYKFHENQFDFAKRRARIQQIVQFYYGKGVPVFLSQTDQPFINL